MPAHPKFPAEEFRKEQYLLPVSERRARVGDSGSLGSCGRRVGAQRELCIKCNQAVGALPLAYMA